MSVRYAPLEASSPLMSNGQHMFVTAGPPLDGEGGWVWDGDGNGVGDGDGNGGRGMKNGGRGTGTGIRGTGDRDVRTGEWNEERKTGERAKWNKGTKKATGNGKTAMDGNGEWMGNGKGERMGNGERGAGAEPGKTNGAREHRTGDDGQGTGEGAGMRRGGTGGTRVGWHDASLGRFPVAPGPTGRPAV